MGRISLIKINVLPRILYPTQMLPLWMPRKVASSIEKLFSEFVRHGKKPREKNKILQMQSNTGGLGLPNILFYNWACHAWIIWGWLCYYLDSTFRVDSWACSPLSLWGMINCKRQNVAKEFKVNLIVYNSVKVWRDIVSFFGRKDLVSMLTPICGNADFIPATPVALNLLEICLKMVLSCLFSNFIFSMAFPRSIFFGTCRFVTLLGS